MFVRSMQVNLFTFPFSEPILARINCKVDVINNGDLRHLFACLPSALGMRLALSFPLFLVAVAEVLRNTSKQAQKRKA